MEQPRHEDSENRSMIRFLQFLKDGDKRENFAKEFVSQYQILDNMQKKYV